MKKSIAMLTCGILLSTSFAAENPVGVSSSNMRKVNANTDVLGRHNSKVTNTPTVFVAAPKPQQALQKASYEPVVDKAWGRFERYKINGSYVMKYWFNDAEVSASTYITKVNQYDQKFANAVDNVGRSYKNYNYLNSDYYSVSREPFEETGYTYTGNICRDGLHCYDISYFDIEKIINKVKANKNLGSGIGVYVAESQAPNKLEVTYKPLYTCANPVSHLSNVNHASKVVKTLKTLASNATVYTIPMNCLSDNVLNSPERPDQKNPVVYIGNHSYSGPTATDKSDYDSEETRFIDSYVYNTRVIEFASAGNEGTEKNRIGAKGRGLNVIAVGAVTLMPNASGNIVARFDDHSSRNNPSLDKEVASTEYDKPEIYSPSNFLFRNDYVYYYKDVKNNKSSVEKPVFSATSAAAPFTAGLTAELLDSRPFYRWHPEVVKALLLTSSVNSIEKTSAQTDDISNNTNKLIGKGYPSFDAMVNNSRSRYWTGNNGDFFKNSQFIYGNKMVTKSNISFKETNITAGKKYRIAIAWLSNPDLIGSTNGEIPQDIDLMVTQGNDKYYSSSSGNPFEFLEFTARSGSDLTIRIIRDRNNGGRVMLGYNLYEVQ